VSILLLFTSVHSSLLTRRIAQKSGKQGNWLLFVNFALCSWLAGAVPLRSLRSLDVRACPSFWFGPSCHFPLLRLSFRRCSFTLSFRFLKILRLSTSFGNAPPCRTTLSHTLPKPQPVDQHPLSTTTTPPPPFVQWTTTRATRIPTVEMTTGRGRSLGQGEEDNHLRFARMRRGEGSTWAVRERGTTGTGTTRTSPSQQPTHSPSNRTVTPLTALLLPPSEPKHLTHPTSTCT
jgi:hypothetical protein